MELAEDPECYDHLPLMASNGSLLATTALECVIRGLEQANYWKRRMMGFDSSPTES